MPGEALSRLRLQVALVWGSGPADTGRLRRLQVLWVPAPRAPSATHRCRCPLGTRGKSSKPRFEQATSASDAAKGPIPVVPGAGPPRPRAPWEGGVLAKPPGSRGVVGRAGRTPAQWPCPALAQSPQPGVWTGAALTPHAPACTPAAAPREPHLRHAALRAQARAAASARRGAPRPLPAASAACLQSRRHVHGGVSSPLGLFRGLWSQVRTSWASGDACSLP